MIVKQSFVLAMLAGGLAACGPQTTLMDERCAQYGHGEGAEAAADTDGKGVVHLEPPVEGDCIAPVPPVVPELPPDDDDDDDDDNNGGGNGGNGGGNGGNGGGNGDLGSADASSGPSTPDGGGASASTNTETDGPKFSASSSSGT